MVKLEVTEVEVEVEAEAVVRVEHMVVTGTCMWTRWKYYGRGIYKNSASHYATFRFYTVFLGVRVSKPINYICRTLQYKKEYSSGNYLNAQ